MFNRNNIVLACAVAYFSVPAAGIAAENSVQKDIENILVTASKTPISLTQTGSSVSVLDSNYLEKRQNVALSEILRDLPGLAVSRSGVLGSATQVRVRGSEGNQVLVMIDGIEVNDLAQAGEFNFAHLLTNHIERIEVIRGPQSALWGSDAIGGVISIITKQANSPLGISAYAELGSFGTEHTGASIGSQGENYHIRLNAAYIDSDGENIAREGSEDDGYENTTYSLTAGVSPVEALDISLSLRHMEAENAFDNVDFATSLPTDSDNITESTHTYGRAQAKLKLLDGRWEHILGYAATHTDNDNFSNGTQNSSNQGEKTRFDYQTNMFFETNGAVDTSQVLSLVLEREEEEYTQRGVASFFGDPNKDLDTGTTSYVGEYRVSFNDKLHLSGSLRKDDNNEFKDAITYRYTAAYNLPTTGTRVRANYGTGVKNPTFTERFGFFDTFIGNPNLTPEKSTSWEMGLDQALMASRLNLGITYFNARLKDEINGFVFDPSLSNFTAANENGSSHRQGLEFIFTYQLSEQLALSGAYTYTDSTQPAGNDEIDEIRRPRHTGNLNLDYDFLNGRANINLNASFTGKQGDDFFATFPATRVTLDEFTLVTLSSSYQLTDKISVYGRIENLMDEDYEEVFGFSTPGAGVYLGTRIGF